MFKLIGYFLIVIALCVAFFSFTNPSALPVGFLIVPVVLTFALFALGSYILMRLTFTHLGAPRTHRTFAVLVGISASMIVLFQSTGGIVWADIILMSLFLVISYLYITKL